MTIPLPGYDDKRIYVWFEAVMGYFTATVEWAEQRDQASPDAWKEWWGDQTAADVRSYYFIGKDNITFHTIHWPGYLIGKGGLNLPYDVPANEYLNSYGPQVLRRAEGPPYYASWTCCRATKPMLGVMC